MSYYPPGVTGNEPEIAGDSEHYARCPMNEQTHQCARAMSKHMAVEWDGHWSLVVTRHIGYPTYVAIAFCPFCGDELTALRCECDEIANALREKAQEEKLGNQ